MNTEQGTDTYCRAATFYTSTLQSESRVDSRSILVRKSPPHESSEIVVLASLQKIILNLCHNAPIVGYPGPQRMTVPFGATFTGHTWQVMFYLQSHNEWGMPKQATDIVKSDAFKYSQHPFHSSLSQWTFAAHCQGQDKVAESSLFWWIVLWNYSESFSLLKRHQHTWQTYFLTIGLFHLVFPNLF